jgi:hypothetical protein
LFDELVDHWRRSGGAAAETRLQEMKPADLRVVAKEIGLSAGTKVPMRTLVAQVMGKINESILLSKNVTRAPGPAAAIEAGEESGPRVPNQGAAPYCGHEAIPSDRTGENPSGRGE